MRGNIGLDKQCPYCGALMPQEAHFCLSCFNAISEPQNSAALVPVKHKKPLANHAERGVSVLLSSLLVFGMLFSFFTADFPKKKLPTASAEDGSSLQNPSAHALAANVHGTRSEGETEDTALLADGEMQALPTLTKLPNISSMLSETALPSPGISEESLPPYLSEHPAQDSSQGSNSNAPTEEPTTSHPVKPETPTSPDSDETDSKPSVMPPVEYSNFEYKKESAKYICITKYKGNSKVVTIPAVIDGKPVTRINKDTFNGQKGTQEIFFETNKQQPYLWVDTACMHNLPNLRLVHFPDTDLGIQDEFARSCPKLENLTLSSGTYEGQYQMVDGALYYYTSRDWVLRFYCPACKKTDLKIPAWAKGFENVCNLKDNPYVRRIYFGKHATTFTNGIKLPDQLEAIHVEKGNFCGYSQDGILYIQNYDGIHETTYSCVYPPGKKDPVFHCPEHVYLDLARQSNRYLEELYLSNTSTVNFMFGTSYFPSIRKIQLPQNHDQVSEIQRYFKGQIVYT